MNSAKWEAETWLGRKPKVPVEIIDEGDEFLDGLTYRTSVTRRLFERIRREGLVDDDTLRLSLEHFQDTLDLLRRVRYDETFSFRYSKRPGTGAAKLPGQVPEE